MVILVQLRFSNIEPAVHLIKQRVKRLESRDKWLFQQVQADQLQNHAYHKHQKHTSDHTRHVQWRCGEISADIQYPVPDKRRKLLILMDKIHAKHGFCQNIDDLIGTYIHVLENIEQCYSKYDLYK